MSQLEFDYKVPVWKINDLEFEFDVENPQTWVRYENSYRAFMEKAKHVPKDGGRSKAMKYELSAIKQLFNDLFGNHAGDRIFKGQPNNRRYYYAVHNNFVKFVDKCRQDSDNYLMENAETELYEPSTGKLA